ncbi:hypothetical protein AURDEDRAFT_165950 [Auricularia subglabra TFB-10046 SS5]|nr:hypothetical protein AURDEDRAFT_165950 [Auricularia subglabra TFB-10046 SS5]
MFKADAKPRSTRKKVGAQEACRKGVAPWSPSSDARSPPSVALHVLRVAPGTPVSQASLELFFDFIVGVSGFDASAADITQDAVPDELEALVARGLSLELIVWSRKTCEKRQHLKIYPEVF